MKVSELDDYRHDPGDKEAPIERFRQRVERWRDNGQGRYMCRCPAHEDKNPSLSVRENDDGMLLLHCFAGCSTSDILDAVGLSWRQMWPWDSPGGANGSQRSRDRLSYYRTMLSILAADKDAGKPETDESRAAKAEAIRELERTGEGPPDEPQPVPLPPTINEFLGLHFEPLQPIMGPFTSHQLVMVHATAGAGKTMFTLNLGWHSSEGKDFLGWQSAGPQKVLVIDGEMSAHMQQERLKCGGSDRFRIANLAGWGSDLEPLNIATEAGQLMVRYWLEATQTRILILDNLMSLAWVDGTSVNSDEFWTPVRRFVIQLRAAGYLVVIVDHSNTVSGEIFGTKTKLWHADLVLRLTQIEQEDPVELGLSQKLGQRPKIRLAWDKVRSGTKPDEITVRLGGVGQGLMWEKSAVSDAREAREMRKNGMTIRDIADSLGVSKSKVGRWCK